MRAGTPAITTILLTTNAPEIVLDFQPNRRTAKPIAERGIFVRGDFKLYDVRAGQCSGMSP
jgi:hypothetical protein